MKDDSMMQVWIVEMLNNDLLKPKWQPTIGTALSREDGRKELKEWKLYNQCDKFRLRQYVRKGA